ncbi:MAG: OmpA family protein [Azospirillaceae bacterium]
MPVRLLALALLAIAFGALPVAAQEPEPDASDCAGLEAAVAARFAEGDRAALVRLSDQIADGRCGAAWTEAIGTRIALLTVAQGQQALEAGMPPAEVAGRLDRALERYARPWQALALRGDLAYESRDWTVAVRHYQEALDVIDNAAATPRAPDAAVIRGIHERAQRAWALAPTYVPTTRSRDGSPAGLVAASIRGVGMGRVPVPIEFEFDSTTMTPKGQAAIADLVDAIRARGAAGPVILEGHTDRTGPAAYNCALSRRRAAAVEAYLDRALDREVEIIARPLGEHAPEITEADEDAGYLTPDQIRQINRRVDWVFDPAAADRPSPCEAR